MKFVVVFSGLRLHRSTCAIDRGAKTRIGCRIKDFVIDILGLLLSIGSKITMAYECVLKCGMACHSTDTMSERSPSLNCVESKQLTSCSIWVFHDPPCTKRTLFCHGEAHQPMNANAWVLEVPQAHHHTCLKLMVD